MESFGRKERKWYSRSCGKDKFLQLLMPVRIKRIVNGRCKVISQGQTPSESGNLVVVVSQTFLSCSFVQFEQSWASKPEWGVLHVSMNFVCHQSRRIFWSGIFSFMLNFTKMQRILEIFDLWLEQQPTIFSICYQSLFLIH